MPDFVNGTEELNPAKIASAVAFDLRKEVKTNFRGCRDDTAIAAANVIEGLMRQRNELLDALKDMRNGWRYIRETNGDLYGVGWDRAEDKANAAIANAEA